MSNYGLNFTGNSRAKLKNVNVGPHAKMIVNEAPTEVEARMSELRAAIEEHRATLPAGVVSEANAVEAELGEPEPQKDRIVQAMRRIREGAASASAVVAAAGAVLKALGAG